MYKERKGKMITQAWQHGLDNFLEHAFSLPDALVDGESHYPCTKCFCRHKRKRDEMTRHLCHNGFVLGYDRWTSHGEYDTPEVIEQDNDADVDRMDDMLIDAIAAEGVSVGDEPTEAAKKFYEILVEADKPLHEKTTQSRLSIVGRLMTIKTQHNLSESCYNDIMSVIHDIVGDDAAKDLPVNFHRSKKLVHSLAMPYVKIHACPNNRMIYYKEIENVFQHQGNLRGRGNALDLTPQELNAARLYILTNCSVVDRFIEAFTEEKYSEHPNLIAAGLDKIMIEEFVEWFKIACKSDPDSDEDLWNLANGCSSRFYPYSSYDVNGFRFRTGRLSHRRPVSLTRSNRSSSATSVGNNRSSQSTEQTKKARTPRRKTEAGNRLEEIDRPLIVPHGILWEKHPYTSREPSTVQGALVRQMYPEPIGPAGDQKPVLCWEDYKWSPGAGVRTAASRIVEEFWWRFKCDPLNQEQADAALEENFTNKVRQMLHEEKAAAIKRLNKKGQMPTEVDEEGNRWPTKEALISAKPPDFGTVIGWRLLCEHWSTAAFRKISFTNSKNRLAHGKTVFHCSGARSVVSTRQHLKLKTSKDPRITGAWHHTHNLHRGTDQEKICSQRISKRWS
uniref:Uncharacterized protein n=1 Tax=Avena sativa TaxID=4498 RepID=A0ACD5ZBG1_AVESA